MGNARCNIQVVINRRKTKNWASEEPGLQPQLVHGTFFPERKREAGRGEKGSEVILMETFEARLEAPILGLGYSCGWILGPSHHSANNHVATKAPHHVAPQTWNISTWALKARFPHKSPSYPLNPPCMMTGLFPSKGRGWQCAKSIDTAVV